MHVLSNLSSPSSSPSMLNQLAILPVLVVLGGQPVSQALAQVAGSRITPVAFSFGWVTYTVVSALKVIRQNKVMPSPDCSCKVINGDTGYVRENTSWIIGRIVRDFETWMNDSKWDGDIRKRVDEILDEEWRETRDEERPAKAGLCVSVFKAEHALPGHPGRDWVYFSGFAAMMVQAGLAAIPCFLHGHSSILLITLAGIALSFATGSLAQWTFDKWACGRQSEKTVILTEGDGSQHAMIIIGDRKGLDLEELAAVSSTPTSPAPSWLVSIVAAALWILLLESAVKIQEYTGYLFAIAIIGMLHNIYVATASRSPEDFGVLLKFVEVIGHHKVMEALFEVERRYPGVGRSMLPVFFSGQIRQDERDQWHKFDDELMMN
ncbi:hypothetical protein F4777DRAFT_236376 [Nemania sp. FL0916]|nr:hypothetical protein F4777DRAFT_236376 [Nemania sp. FL0916]